MVHFRIHFCMLIPSLSKFLVAHYSVKGIGQAVEIKLKYLQLNPILVFCVLFFIVMEKGLA